MYMNILILDDEEGLRKGLSKTLALEGFTIFEAATAEQAREIIEKRDIHILLLDLKLKSENGFDFLKELHSAEPFISIIIITGHGDVKSAVECMREGAINYITKPIDHSLLLSVLAKEAEALRSRQETLAFRTTLETNTIRPFLPSLHAEMGKIEQVISKVRNSDATILILGETGTGKELVARKIHYSGSYCERPFVPVNCAALNENLLESELFGHERGSFTGAVSRKLGRFELVGSGTLFLDEVGDMSPSMQSKLLRVLQEKKFERVGGIKTITSRCRIIAATNRNLEDLISQGLFRPDLFYRLSLVTLTLPPLRSRKEDIPGFIDLFVREANEKYNRHVKTVSPKLKEYLSGLSWPGNIRQLKNVITNAVLLNEGEDLTILDLPGMSGKEPEIMQREDLKSAVSRHTESMERTIIASVLSSFDGNVSKTAAKLGISRKTLYQKMRLYGI